MAGVSCFVECVSELGSLWPRTGEEDKVSTGEVTETSATVLSAAA